ncbi:SDR family oxidoreductase [Bacillus timonensis]|nr:SDR family oxidoreductase [Bacillus timonensis]
MGNHRLEGKSIVITGASSGLGEKLAYLVAEQGARPILLARSYDKLQEIATNVHKLYGITPLYFKLDVSDLDSIETVFTEILNQVESIDVLVNNAGFGIFDTVANSELSAMKAMFEVNVFGLIACTKQVLPSMIRHNSGHIINVASQAGKIATPKSSVYAASKHAVLGFTNSLRMELYDKAIHVTAVNPGPIKTRFFDIADETGDYKKNVEKFMLDPEEVARKIVDLMCTSKRELNLPGWMSFGSKLYQLFPAFVERVGGRAFYKK